MASRYVYAEVVLNCREEWETMIDITVLPLFLVTVVFLAISPGPDLLLISTYSSMHGFRSGILVSVGILVAGVIQTVLVAFGLGTLLQAMPPLAMVIKSVGALYLAWLGVILLRGWMKNKTSVPGDSETAPPSAGALIRRGLFNNLMNPKALLFFSMFLPQFVSAQQDWTSQILMLGILLSSVVFCINIGFVFSFSRLGALLGQKLRLGRHIDGLLGVIFLGLAARLATSK
jgi:threonine/homoserine/homoserine lactone efflux protein